MKYNLERGGAVTNADFASLRPNREIAPVYGILTPDQLAERAETITPIGPPRPYTIGVPFLVTSEEFSGIRNEARTQGVFLGDLLTHVTHAAVQEVYDPEKTTVSRLRQLGVPDRKTPIAFRVQAPFDGDITTAANDAGVSRQDFLAGSVAAHLRSRR